MEILGRVVGTPTFDFPRAQLALAATTNARHALDPSRPRSAPSNGHHAATVATVRTPYELIRGVILSRKCQKTESIGKPIGIFRGF
ncbi:hypothetical protein V6N11_077053 [Hibiscus sabdariffa]|uniref:Uncharacterized protein n=1 Tax=Hibiscus sabdariffa TaxID=183260 RepID=A0ABR2TCP7_9ROSI